MRLLPGRTECHSVVPGSLPGTGAWGGLHLARLFSPVDSSRAAGRLPAVDGVTPRPPRNRSHPDERGIELETEAQIVGEEG